jgi:hypothetical protein
VSEKQSKMPKQFTDYNICHIIFFNPSRKVNVDLDSVLSILLLDGVQKGMKPLGRAIVADNPGKVDLGEPGRLGVMQVIHAIPDRLQDSEKGA